MMWLLKSTVGIFNIHTWQVKQLAKLCLSSPLFKSYMVCKILNINEIDIFANKQRMSSI